MNLRNRIRELELANMGRSLEPFDISLLSDADQDRVAELNQKAGDDWNLEALTHNDLIELREIVRRAAEVTQ